MLQDIFAALAQQDAREAIRLADALVAASPEDAEARHAQGLALQMGGRHTDAAAAIDQAIALAPLTARFHVARAAIAMRQRDPARARRALDAAVEADPNQFNAYVLAAHLAIARGDAAEAERQLALAKRLDDSHPLLVAIEGTLAQQRGDMPRALALLSAAAQAMPDEPLILASLGLAYLDAGHLAFAEQALRRALERQPGARRLRWALIEAKRRQGHLAELPAELEAVLAEDPADARALALLGDCQLAAGRGEAALDVLRRLLALAAPAEAALAGLLRALQLGGHGAAAAAALDRRLDEQPQAEALWRQRLGLVEHDVVAARALLDRWAAAQPQSLDQRALRAALDEAEGQLDAAEAGAEAVLAQRPGHAGVNSIVLRARLRRDPQAAMALADSLLASSGGDIGRRFALLWRGLALDRLDRCDEAAACWKALAAEAPEGVVFPTAVALPESVEATGEAEAPRLLWGPPGSRVLEVAGMLRQQPGLVLLDDRWGQAPRPDGLWPLRADGRRVDAAGWHQLLASAGIAGSDAIDWLPHWDGRIQHALPGHHLVAVISDPRDLLLNALVFGGPQAWTLPRLDALVDWLAGTCTLLAERHGRQPAQTLIVRADQLATAADAVAATLQAFLGLPTPPPSTGIDAARHSVGGMPNCFPPGRWRHYAGAFADEFTRLAPVAERLGFA